MSKQHLKLTYALKNGEIVHISSVEKGLACECFCPACGETLVAKKGEKMMHHFAHSSGSTCEYGYESSLHLAAKDILSKAEKMVIPAAYLEFFGTDKRNQVIADAREISIDKVELEKHTRNIVPDIVVYSGDKKLFVEIYVTHKIDDEKLKKIKNLNISTIEINLSKLNETVEIEELTDILLGNSPEKIWKYNAVVQKWQKRFNQVSEKKYVRHKRYSAQIDYCPIKASTWYRKPNADFAADCLCCRYHIKSHFNDEDFVDWILCSGKSRIAEIKDFKILDQESKKRG